MSRTPLLAFAAAASLAAVAFAPALDVGDGAATPLDGKGQSVLAGDIRGDGLGLGQVQVLEQVGCVQDMAGPFQCNNVDLVDHVPTAMFGGAGHGSDSWGWTAADGTEYVIVTSGDGHGFLRLTEDGTTEYLGTLPRAYVQDNGGTPILWNDVKVVNDHAYITAEDSSASQQYGVQVVDLNRVAAMEASDPTTGLVTIEEDGNIGDGLAGHNLVAFPERDLLGVVLGEHEECGGNLVFYDVGADPVAPTEIGCAWAEGHPNSVDTPHDAQCVVYAGPDPDYNGAGGDGVLGTVDDTAPRDVCALFNQYDGGLILVDATAVTRDRTGTRAEFINRFTYETMNYTHQGWFTDDHEFVMFNDELDESGGAALGVGGGGPTAHNTNTTTYWVDVSDLDVLAADQAPIPGDDYNESLVKAWSNPSTVAIDHNMYPVGNRLYQANYGAGLRVLEFSAESLRGPAEDALTEVAYFDTYPGPGPSEFYGAWNVYPFFASGNIILSDFQAGLLVLDVDEEAIEAAR